MFGVAFLYSGGLWFLFTVEVSPSGWAGSLACRGFLVKEACVSVLVGGAGFLLLECSGVSSSEFLDWSMGLV